MITRGTWEYKLSKDIGHKKTMTGLAWLGEKMLATCGLDKVIKVWDFEREKLVNYMQSENEVV